FNPQEDEEIDDDTLSVSTNQTAGSEVAVPSTPSAAGEDLSDPAVALKRSISHPAVLVGWKIFVPGIGTGTILALKRKRFATTKFVVQFDQ
ncbi:hypothetical protein O6382_24330, partial [Salmonella enterica subsp. enterica]